MSSVLFVAALAFVAPALQSGETYSRVVAPFLQKQCADCHGEAKQKGGLDFRDFPDEVAALSDLDLFEEVRFRLLEGEMPPEERPRPTKQSIDAVVAWIDAAVAEDAHRNAGDPGRPTLRRLTRLEYKNSVRDLFGVHYDTDQAFPTDDVGSGFDNDGDVLSLSPLLFEKYLAAAEAIAVRALAPYGPPAPVRVPASELWNPDRNHKMRDGRRVLASNGSIAATLELATTAIYRVRLRLGAQQAGDELARAALVLEKRELGVFDVAATIPELETFELEVELSAGRQRLEIEFSNDYYEPTHADPARRDRNLHVAWLELEGPIATVDGELPPLAQPVSGPLADWDLSSIEDEGADLQPIVAPLARRVWRRPVTKAELRSLVDVAPKRGPILERLERILVALLVSPHFLYRVELDPDPADASQVHELSQHELATRLSYFLWSSTPDAELSHLADEGRLSEFGTLRVQTRRLLRDARASALVPGFFAQWLQLRRLQGVVPDRERFGDFDPELREAMRAETELFVEAILREERPVEDLLQADFTYLNQPLAEHYGIEGVRGAHMRRVPVDEGPRRGLLGHASLLTLTSNPTRTSPVKRGKWVLEVLLASPPKPPPPGVGVLTDEGPDEGLSLREQLAVHRAKPECAACHDSLDPPGLGLENFDAVGRWRTSEGGVSIDARGELEGVGEFEGPAGLTQRVLEAPGFRRSIVENLFAYALGRALTRSDRGRIEALLGEFENREMTFAGILEHIVLSDAFRKRRGEDSQ